MESQDEVAPEYIQGFNEGYLIAQNLPELADQLSRIQADGNRMAGFKAGREQYVTERLKERLPSWLKGDRASKEQNAINKQKGRNIEPDKD